MKRLILILASACLPCVSAAPALPPPAKGTSIALVGSGLGERMQYDGWFETLLHLRFPSAELKVRNLCFPGDTAAYRPRAGRNSPWAFPGADKLRPEFRTHRGNGIEPAPDDWLAICKADVVLGFFGYNESFAGPEGIPAFEAELDAWITHTQAQRYNGSSAPRVALVSPIAFETARAGDPKAEDLAKDADLAAYTAAMGRVAARRGVHFVDLHAASRELAAQPEGPLTFNGFLPDDAGNKRLAPKLVDALFGPGPVAAKGSVEALHEAVNDKAWHWHNDYRITNGVHVYGRRRDPFGTFNYPQEIEKLRQMTANRDRAVWAVARGERFDLAAADQATRGLDPVPSNFPAPIQFKTGEEAIQSIRMMDGFKIELFASEKEFPDLRNPVQIAFDARGRLWVSVMPCYPHYRPGDPKPDDRILILEDTNGDGKADKRTVFADKLHLPIGFELQPEGVYVTSQPNLMLLRDTDGDDVADVRELVMHGFDSHDTHHAIGAFCSDPSGAFYLLEGTFLHSQVETAYGPRRDSDSGVWRYEPRTRRLERYHQVGYANPWGVAFDDWGQCYIADASPGQNWWGLPLSVKVGPGRQVEKTAEFAPKRARPTSGAEFISSRHFPEELQGGYLVNNVIGFLGTSIHDIREDGSGFAGKVRGDLVSSSDPNFRPCDLEFAPDGSLYLLDWHNPLIGHMQHSARDPKRDRDHGRVYRITYPARPLVKPVTIAGAPVAELLKALEEPEIRTRYRARGELRCRPADEVLTAVNTWLAGLDPNAPRFEHHLCEALWTTWGMGRVDRAILARCLAAKSHQARAAAVDVIRFAWRGIPDHAALLATAAADSHPRVRLAAMVAASWIQPADGAAVASVALERPADAWMIKSFQAALETLRGPLAALAKSPGFPAAERPLTMAFLGGTLKLEPAAAVLPPPPEPKLAEEDLKLFRLGREVYARDAHCATCHQPHGNGDAIYPPLGGSEWVTGDENRLVKLALKGLWGPIQVKGKTYDPKNGLPPMIGFEHLLKDEELAGVLTYVRNSFGNSAPAVKPAKVAEIRAAIRDKKDFFTVEDLLQQHPF